MTPPRSIASFRRKTAQQLRKNTTLAERKLWRHLRQFPLLGSHFRRQVPIGPYVADFACMASKLLIEVDSSQHGRDAELAYDQVRTRWLEAEGYRVIRFWNNDISNNIDGVMEAIYAAVYGSSNADPSELKHRRQKVHPTPARFARRPSPSRGG